MPFNSSALSGATKCCHLRGEVVLTKLGTKLSAAAISAGSYQHYHTNRI